MVNLNLKLRHHLDFETRSRADLKKVGAWAYALHPSTQITCMTFGPSRDRLVTYNGLDIGFDWSRVLPPADWAALNITAHSADFEYAIANLILHRRHGWPARWEPSLWRCTLAKAAACGLPLGLDPLGRILQIKTPKDLEGRATMLQLSQPLYVDALFGPTYDETPAKFQKLCSYNRTDVCAEIEVDESLPDLVPAEQIIWEHYLVVNRRGITIDTAFAAKAASLAIPLVDKLNARLHAITCTVPRCTVKTCNGVDKASRVAALKNFLAARFNIVVDSLDKEGVTDLLEDPMLDPLAREVLTIRRQVGKKNSVAKYVAAQDCVSPDGRARGLIQYHGAHTGRTSGRLLQPHNMPKGFKEKAQRKALDAIMQLDAPGFLDAYGDKSMDTLSDASRGLFIAAPDKELACADFNAIEARVLFWEAGEQEALDAYDRGESPYVDMARYIYNNPLIVKPTETDKTYEVEYDIGKRTILGCGYQMGWKRFQSNIYTETAKVGKPVWIEDKLAQRAVKAYREKYARVKALWYDTERAAINAVRSPGSVYTCGAVGRIAWSMSMDRRFLLCRLPSGRFLRYWQPSLVGSWRTWCEDPGCPHMTAFEGAEKCPRREWKEQLCFMGEHEDTHQWVPLATYGGALVENYTQAVARDLMVNGMLKVQAKGYDVLLDVYDEVLSERAAPDLKEFIAAMCDKPVWAASCPIAAEGWIGRRYHK